MPRGSHTLVCLLCASTIVLMGEEASAQLGPLVWKLDPYCNVITVTAYAESGGYRLSGFDDACGATQRAPLAGMVTPNPDGTFSFTFVVRAPDGRVVHTSAILTPATLSGTWRDSGGQTGTLLFGASTGGGAPLPLPPVEGAVGSVTSATIADGTIGAIDIDAAEVQRRVSGTCGSGLFVQSVAPDGTVTCGAAVSTSGGDITAVTAGAGLNGGATSGPATLAVYFTEVQARLTAACPAGQFLRAVGQDGAPTCGAPPPGDITSVSAGAGLSGGAATGDAALAVNFAAVQARIGGACGQGSFMSGADDSGNPICTRGATAGTENVVLGSAPAGGVAGTLNTVVGNRAALGGLSGNENVAIGGSALGASSAGSFNVAVGSRALISGTAGTENVSVGAQALPNSNGDFNTAVGSRAVGGVTGSGNAALGSFALTSLAAGDGNVAAGAQALVSLADGSSNIALGPSAGFLLQTGTNNIYVGHPGMPGETGESNTIRIGMPPQGPTFIAGIYGAAAADTIPVAIDPNGQLVAPSSSRRYKQDVRDMGDASRRLLDLRPVTFRYAARSTAGDTNADYGLIAEEVSEVYPDLVSRNAAGEPEAVQYQKLTPMLLNELQRQQRTIDELMRRLSAAEAALRALTSSHP